MKTRALQVATLLLCACPASQTKLGGDTAVGNAAEPLKVELTQDQETEVAPGLKVTLKSVMYTHATDKTGRSVNDSFMQLDVTHDGKTESVTLTRLFPDGPVFTKVAKVQLAIDYVDAYHQPSTGAVLVMR